MTEERSFRGFWFLPGNEDRKISGTLVFDPISGIELTLIGGLVDFHSSEYIHRPIIINGITSEESEITLFKCTEASRTLASAGIEESSYYAEYAFLGHHFSTEDSVSFISIGARFNIMDEWLGISGFQKLEHDLKEKSSIIEFKLPEIIGYQIIDSLHCDFTYHYIKPIINKAHKISLEQTVEVWLSSEEQTNFENILGYLNHFQDLLTITSYKSFYPLYISLVKISRDSGGQIEPKPIKLLKRNRLLKRESEKDGLFGVFIKYKDIKDDFNSVLVNWFTNLRLLSPIVYHLSNSINNPKKFNENDFLNITQALEAFHRGFKINHVLPKEIHKNRIREITTSVDPKYKAWLNERLAFSNEPSFHKRLLDLLELLSFQPIIAIIKDSETFIRDVKNSRNYYTHYDKRLANKAKRGSELYYITEKLKLILLCSLLLEMGMSAIKVEEILKGSISSIFNHLID